MAKYYIADDHKFDMPGHLFKVEKDANPEKSSAEIECEYFCKMLVNYYTRRYCEISERYGNDLASKCMDQIHKDISESLSGY